MYGAENSANPSKSHKAVDAFINGLTIIPIFGSIKLFAKEKVRLKNATTNCRIFFFIANAFSTLINLKNLLNYESSIIVNGFLY